MIIPIGNIVFCQSFAQTFMSVGKRYIVYFCKINNIKHVIL